jgi:hypothetical protein
MHRGFLGAQGSGRVTTSADPNGAFTLCFNDSGSEGRRPAANGGERKTWSAKPYLEEFMAATDYLVEQGLLIMKKYRELFLADYRFSP